MARYLFAQWDGGGSLPPELTVVRHLTRAGHTVTVLGDPVTEPEVRAVGVTDFRPWVDAPHHVTRNVEDDYTRDWEVRSPISVSMRLPSTPIALCVRVDQAAVLPGQAARGVRLRRSAALRRARLPDRGRARSLGLRLRLHADVSDSEREGAAVSFARRHTVAAGGDSRRGRRRAGPVHLTESERSEGSKLRSTGTRREPGMSSPVKSSSATTFQNSSMARRLSSSTRW